MDVLAWTRLHGRACMDALAWTRLHVQLLHARANMGVNARIVCKNSLASRCSCMHALPQHTSPHSGMQTSAKVHTSRSYPCPHWCLEGFKTQTGVQASTANFKRTPAHML